MPPGSADVFAKLEYMNPGGSVKDRAAIGIIARAEEQGLLKPGGTIVEATAGNTGIGLAHICAARGYKCVIVIPDNQSQEKMDLLRVLGAEVRPVPPKPYVDNDNYQKIAGRLAQSMPNAIWAQQFDNVVNRQAHYETTGPEIGEQKRPRWSPRIALASLVLALVLTGTGLFVKNHEARAGTFFGSGALLLTAGLAALWAAMKRTRDAALASSSPDFNIPTLAWRNAARNPLRSLLTAGLLASAAFLIVVVELFRQVISGLLAVDRRFERLHAGLGFICHQRVVAGANRFCALNILSCVVFHGKLPLLQVTEQLAH